MNSLIISGRLNMEGSAIDKTQKVESGKGKSLKNAVKDFESIFIYYMLQTLRKTVPKDGLFSQETSSKNTYNMMLDQKMAEDLAKGKGIGLQKMLLNQLDRSHHCNSSISQDIPN
jgi:flagellar protein FlgJ